MREYPEYTQLQYVGSTSISGSHIVFLGRSFAANIRRDAGNVQGGGHGVLPVRQRQARVGAGRGKRGQTGRGAAQRLQAFRGTPRRGDGDLRQGPPARATPPGREWYGERTRLSGAADVSRGTSETRGSRRTGAERAPGRCSRLRY